VSSAPTALITGITGQDGSFLAEQLLERGYGVSGIVRAGARAPLGSSEHLRGQIELVRGDLLEPHTLRRAIESARPSEVYHLAAPSFVPASWELPEESTRAILGSCAAILEAVRDSEEPIRVFVSASGAMFGEAPESPQSEQTPCRPTTPYAIAKLAAHQLVGAMREHDGLFACSGIVFNHESERRPEQFVTRRITRAAAAISLGLRDWSFAGDIMHGAWLALQQDSASDYVLCSGTAHTVADLAQTAFACVGLDAESHVRVDPSLVRGAEGTPSVGDPTRARERLGWRPELDFEALVERMVEADLCDLRASASLS